MYCLFVGVVNKIIVLVEKKKEKRDENKCMKI